MTTNSEPALVSEALAVAIAALETLPTVPSAVQSQQEQMRHVLTARVGTETAEAMVRAARLLLTSHELDTLSRERQGGVR